MVQTSHTEHQHAQQNNTMWQRVIQNINMLNKILQWCRQSYRTSTCSTKYYNGVDNGIDRHTEHQHAQQNTQHAQQNTTMVQTVIQNINMLNKILQWCRQSYHEHQHAQQNTTIWYRVHTEHQHAQQNNTMWQRVIQNINMLNKILEWCRQSYRTSTCSTKYYNVVESHTEQQHQQNTTMVQTVIQNINMLNKILQCGSESYRTSTCTMVQTSHTEHQHAQQNTTMVQTVIQNINMLNKILQ